MTFFFYDPPPQHEYLSLMFFNPLRAYCGDHRIPWSSITYPAQAQNGVVLTLADNLTHQNIALLKTNGNKIVAFNVIDSSYLSQKVAFEDWENIDLWFHLSGLQLINTGHSFTVDSDFQIQLKEKQFMPSAQWEVFDRMRRSGRLQSLPYVPWNKLPEVTPRPYNQRSQKVLLRGGAHVRRFILALFLMRHDLLDVNSAFLTHYYFADNMNPQFRYCGDCLETYKLYGRFPYRENPERNYYCNSPAKWGGTILDLSDLGQWNNRCPKSFYWLTEQFAKRYGPVDMKLVETMLNARALPTGNYMEQLSRITFTSDLKWLFSIYAPQRFWQAAAAGCINVLPMRTDDQNYFPPMLAGDHYMVFNEELAFPNADFAIEEKDYYRIAGAAKELYDRWIKADQYQTNTLLLRRIT